MLRREPEIGCQIADIAIRRPKEPPLPRARVSSFQALHDARAAIADFIESASATLASVDADVGRMTHWLSHDRPSHWARESRLRAEDVEAKKADIARKRIIAAPEPASVVFEERALRRSVQRFEEAQRRLAATKRWAILWDRDSQVHRSAFGALGESIHGALPEALAELSAMARTLEEYAAIAPPPAPDAPPRESSPEGAP